MKTLPCVGLGTFRSTGEAVHAAVLTALRHGIRHIDTASVYKNEVEVGAAVRQAIAQGFIRSREDVFITSKVSPYEQGTERAAAACAAILQRLDLGYVDLMLIHWPATSRIPPDSPQHAQNRLETWRVLEEMVAKDLARSIGVSNYEIAHLEELLRHAVVPPVVNQVECHPLWPQTALRQFCGEHGVGVVAYSSFGAGVLLDPERFPEVAHIASRSGKAPTQLLLCWGLQKGCVAVLPKSIRAERIAEFSPQAQGMQILADGQWLSKADEAALDALGELQQQKFCWDPSVVV